VPSVHVPTDVGPPDDFVGALTSVPPPLVTATLTATLPSALPEASVTVKVGDEVSAVPTVADAPEPLAACTAVGFAGDVPPSPPPQAATRNAATRDKRRAA
jgi:hypothetical protein